MTLLHFRQDSADTGQVAGLLLACDAEFIPPLSDRVDIAAYAEKLAHKALRFEAWSGDVLAGLVACYTNAPEAFITNVCVLPARHGQSVASRLLARCIECLRQSMSCSSIRLEVDARNLAARKLYAKHGFSIVVQQGDTMTMMLNLKRGE